jgi:hypothetical protein
VIWYVHHYSNVTLCSVYAYALSCTVDLFIVYVHPESSGFPQHRIFVRMNSYVTTGYVLPPTRIHTTAGSPVKYRWYCV